MSIPKVLGKSIWNKHVPFSSMFTLKYIIIAIVVAQQHTSVYKGDGSEFEFQVGERIISFNLVKIHGEFCH